MNSQEVLALLNTLGYGVSIEVVQHGTVLHCIQGKTEFTLPEFVSIEENDMTLEETVRLCDRLVTGENANARESLQHHVLCNQCDMALLMRLTIDSSSRGLGVMNIEYRAIDEGIASHPIGACPQCKCIVSLETTKEVYESFYNALRRS